MVRNIFFRTWREWIGARVRYYYLKRAIVASVGSESA